MIQEIKGPKLSGLLGVGLVAGSVAALWLWSRVLGALQAYIGYMLASILLVIGGMLIALWILRRFIMGYRYELDGENLALGRQYGRRVRFMDHLMLRSAVACGSFQDMQKRFPGAEIERAVRKDCPIPELAVVFKADSVKIVCLQPNDGIRQAIVAAVKKH